MSVCKFVIFWGFKALWGDKRLWRLSCLSLNPSKLPFSQISSYHAVNIFHSLIHFTVDLWSLVKLIFSPNPFFGGWLGVCSTAQSCLPCKSLQARIHTDPFIPHGPYLPFAHTYICPLILHFLEPKLNERLSNNSKSHKTKLGPKPRPSQKPLKGRILFQKRSRSNIRCAYKSTNKIRVFHIQESQRKG